MVPVSLGKVGRGSSQDGMESVGWSLVMHDPVLAKLSPNKMNFHSLRGGAFLRLGCSSMLSVTHKSKVTLGLQCVPTCVRSYFT